jgi:hypothetical protein
MRTLRTSPGPDHGIQEPIHDKNTRHAICRHTCARDPLEDRETLARRLDGRSLGECCDRRSGGDETRTRRSEKINIERDIARARWLPPGVGLVVV